MRTQRSRMSAVWIGLVLAGLGCCAGAASAQQPVLRFTHLTQDQGLSENTVRAIVEDQKGFMWFGTYDGLNRFDGYTFTVYRNDPDDPNSLSQNQIRALLEDHEGELWIGTHNGLNRYNREVGTFTRYLLDPQDPASLSNNLVYALYEDRAGTLWVGTYWGLNRYDRATDSFTRYLPDEQNPSRGLSIPHVRSIVEDARGDFWIGTDGGGLNRFDPTDRGGNV